MISMKPIQAILLSFCLGSVLVAQETNPRSDPPAGSGQQAAIASPTRVRVSQRVSQSLLLKKVTPDYPAEARARHVQGDVVIRALVGTNGEVQEADLVSGDPLLAPAALKAVRKWKYKPYLLQGRPVEMETQITVIFSLEMR